MPVAPPVQNPRAAVLARVAAWNQGHGPGRQIDPQAELRVAGVEGLSGGIGDSGHAFGPNQLNNAGGVITGRFQGQSPDQINRWAWSPQGIDYALSGVAGAAGGLHGSEAVDAIVRRFERPADPNGEIQRALGGLQVGRGAPAALSAGGTGAAAPDRRAFAQALLSAIDSTGQLDNGGLVGALQARNAGTVGPPEPSPLTTAAAGGAPSGKGGIAELLNEGTGGPTHSTGPHIHAAFTDPQLELAAIQWAQQHGLHVGENPYVGSLSPGVHAPHSYHNVDFPGSYNGRKLGEAIDVSGPDQQAFYEWLASRRR